MVTYILQEQKTVDKANYDEPIPVSEINVPVPPGMWRLGATCSKAKGILLRFASRADRKPKQAEKMSEYYKKYGNPNYGGTIIYIIIILLVKLLFLCPQSIYLAIMHLCASQ
jgi:hypothetical protein